MFPVRAHDGRAPQSYRAIRQRARRSSTVGGNEDYSELPVTPASHQAPCSPMPATECSCISGRSTSGARCGWTVIEPAIMKVATRRSTSTSPMLSMRAKRSTTSSCGWKTTRTTSLNTAASKTGARNRTLFGTTDLAESGCLSGWKQSRGSSRRRCTGPLTCLRRMRNSVGAAERGQTVPVVYSFEQLLVAGQRERPRPPVHLASRSLRSPSTLPPWLLWLPTEYWAAGARPSSGRARLEPGASDADRI